MSNAGGVGRNRDTEPISGFSLVLMLQQARCCQHGRWWTTATVPQVMTLISLVVYCDNQWSSPWILHNHSRPRIVCMTARLDVTLKTTEHNQFVRTGKSKAEVTDNKKTALEVLYYWSSKANYWQTWSIARPLWDSRATCFLFGITL